MGSWAPDGNACTLTLDDNPLADFVELPERFAGLSYCALLCGAIRGALEHASWRVTCVWVSDPLRASAAGELGHSGWELRLTLVEHARTVFHDE